MKKVLFVFLVFAQFIIFPTKGQVQKKPLDFGAINSWPVLHPEQVSDDGRYVMYQLNSGKGGLTWVVQATGFEWKREFAALKVAYFTSDSRRLVFDNKNDSLGIFELQSDSVKYFAGVSSFEMPEENKDWLGFLSKGDSGVFTLLNLANGLERRFQGVVEYFFEAKGKDLLLVKDSVAGSTEIRELVNIELGSDRIARVCKSPLIGTPVFDKTGSKLAFFSELRKDSKDYTVIRYFENDWDTARIIVGPFNTGMDGMSVSAGQLAFSENSNQLFFTVFNASSPSPSAVSIDSPVAIRDYNERADKETFLAAVSIGDSAGRVISLERYGDSREVFFLSNLSYFASYFLVDDLGASRKKHKLFLVSTRNGERRLIKSDIAPLGIGFSPDEKYAIWYDKSERNWYSYRIRDGAVKNITKGISAPLSLEYELASGFPGEPEGVVGWMEGDRAVLIYDRYDIWSVDPDGIKMPVNITGGFGQRNKIRFRFLDVRDRPFGGSSDERPLPIGLADTLLLTGFDVVNKVNGFFSLEVSGANKLRKLVMDSDIYYFPLRYRFPSICGIQEIFVPLKAKKARAFLVSRMNEGRFPNLYFTKDFRSFKALTQYEPQRSYNWYSTELVRWALPNGQPMEGILYKPEDFDPSKKYPILFYVYERNADCQHFYLRPSLSDGRLNIAWFVSNGYVVFVPDISCYQIGYPGKGAYESVTSAVHRLQMYPWVDVHKMGLQGHSYGGWETNFILTQTDIFAAASSASCVSDLVSISAMESTTKKNTYFESGQGRIGSSLSERPDLFVRNSPIFYAGKMTTPLLIMHNVKDGIVPFNQENEWYNELVHLNKKVWMLSYERGGHTLGATKDRLDFSIRLAQFFDYYLRGAATPKWMARGGQP